MTSRKYELSFAVFIVNDGLNKRSEFGNPLNLVDYRSLFMNTVEKSPRVFNEQISGDGILKIVVTFPGKGSSGESRFTRLAWTGNCYDRVLGCQLK